MKINLKSIFGIKFPDINHSSLKNEELEYDKHVAFYYCNLINSLILFSLKTDGLEKLAAPLFDPMFELGSEIEYAFTPVCFETIFRNGLINNSFKSELLAFKQDTDNIPQEVWDCIDNHQTWILIRQKANELLDKLGVESRAFVFDYKTVYDSKGNLLKKVKNSMQGIYNIQTIYDF